MKTGRAALNELLRKSILVEEIMIRVRKALYSLTEEELKVHLKNLKKGTSNASHSSKR